MKEIAIFLLATLVASIGLLWFIHAGGNGYDGGSGLFRFVDTLLQSFVSAALLGLLFELAIWRFGSFQFKNEVDTVKNQVISSIARSSQEVLEKIPMLSATSMENIEVMQPNDASALIRRILEANSSNTRVADSVSRMAAGVIELDDNKVVSNLKHVIRITKEEGIHRMRDTVSYRTKEGLDSFSFGVFASAKHHDAYVSEFGHLEGYWISGKAFPENGGYNGNLVYVSNFMISRLDGKNVSYEFEATPTATHCIYAIKGIDIEGEVTLSYTINSFVSDFNPLIHISSPFVADTMSARVSSETPEFYEILYKVAAPFSGNVKHDVDNKRDIELAINDVVFPGHGFMFALRRAERHL